MNAGEKLTTSLDISKVVQCIAKARAVAGDYKSALQRKGDNDDDLLKQVNIKIRAALILKVGCSMLSHMTQEKDAETLRDKLATEVKQLHKEGIVEKEVFHLVFFNTALAGLPMRGSGAT